MIDFFNLQKAFIIAEAGTCHAAFSQKKRLKRALNYVQKAYEYGADAIKFQMFVAPFTDMFCWIDGDEDRSIRWRYSELRYVQWQVVKNYADSLGITLLASVFQYKTIEWIEELGLSATKVASRAAKTFPYGFGPKPYLVSNGMFGVPDSDDVIELQCEARYPSTQSWKEETVGFSDHSGFPDRAADAIKEGCKLIEVHFYLEPGDAGPDLPASLSLDQLARVCRARDKMVEPLNFLSPIND